MITQAPKGTKDLFGPEMRAWSRLEATVREVCAAFGYGEIRTPTFEHTELFLRGVGDTTDIVQKEMYTFTDKGDRSITLRPEMTAGVARAFIEHGMHNLPLPAKMFYIGPNFRYEAPQAGRLRQHHQFGIECFGAPEPAAEAEVMALGFHVLERLGVQGVNLYINTLGCTECRGVYRQRLREYIAQHLGRLCPDCTRRYEKNPLRALDCKVDGCKAVMQTAPSILDALDDACRAHFQEVQTLLTAQGIPFAVEPKLVRGFDYYTRTVFEFIKEGTSTTIGGGRYDGLVEQLGGAPMPAVGFGMGIERLLLRLAEQDPTHEAPPLPCDIFLGHAGEAGFVRSQELAQTLRRHGIAAESDLLRRSVKAQMKYAGKKAARFSLIIGDNEMETGRAQLKNMDTGAQTEVALEGDVLAQILP